MQKLWGTAVSAGWRTGTRCASLAAMRWLAAVLCVLLAPGAGAGACAAETGAYARAIAAGYKASLLCEGLFTEGRRQADVEALELSGIYPEYDAIVPTLAAEVDGARRRVSVAFDAGLPPRIAQWRPRLGCSTAPIGAAAFDPPRLDRAVPDLDARAWPMGDAGALAAPQGDAGGLARAVEAAFAVTGPRTTAVIVVQDGRIVTERYAYGFGPHTPERTFSVAKSMTATLVGLGVERGLVRVEERAGLPEWARAGDPRAAITIDQLLRMASGLHSGQAGNRTDAIYFGGATVAEDAGRWPLEAVPGTRFRYANDDFLLAARALGLRVGAGWRAFPFAALFEPLGMTRTSVETDPVGDFILSSSVFTTARDLARFGMLYERDGIWQGRRLLPVGWRGYATRMSGPQPERDGYGGGFWRFGLDKGLPADAFATEGNRGQYAVIVPGRHVVIVRRGEDPDGKPFDVVPLVAGVLAALK